MLKAVLVTLAACCAHNADSASVISNDVRRPGFSPACRGATTVTGMVAKSDIVVEAGVIKVSPARNNIYAVTLRVQRVLKEGGGYQSIDKTGQKLQLLFIKPKKRSNRPQLRSLGTAKSYLEACIYEMDLKAGKKYHLFLNSEGGKMTGDSGVTRYVMTGPPVLVTRSSRRKIKAAIKGKLKNLGMMIKSLDVKKSKSGSSMKLVCRTRGPAARPGQLVWTKDGEVISDADVKMKKYKSVLKLKNVVESDAGVYACTTRTPGGKVVHSKSFTLKKTITRKVVNSNEVPILDVTTTSSIPQTTSTTTTTASTTTSSSSPSSSALKPGDHMPCPVSGYCLNGGKCSFIPWLGELSCNCAPGYMGARCERKTTSALYSSLNKMSNVRMLCMFGFSNPYHSC